MRRQRDLPATVLEQQGAARDQLVLLMNSVLRDPLVRGEMSLIPGAIFSRLVAENQARMCWEHPDDVFVKAPLARVRMNTDAVRTWFTSLTGAFEPKETLAAEGRPPLGMRAVYVELFVRHITFVSWRVFLEAFRTVIANLALRLKEQRATRPSRIVFLMLGAHAVAKSNAWLAGYAWPQLAHYVDYIVTNMEGVTGFFKTVEQRKLTSLDADVIYIDDMIYSGSQAAHALFDKYSGVDARYAARVTIHVAAPYITHAGRQRLEESNNQGATLLFVSGTVVVPAYGPQVVALCDTLLTHYAGVSAGLRIALRHLASETRPVIIFEHKLADDVSVPDFLIRDDYFGLGVPRLVNAPEPPFYKHFEFWWTNRRTHDMHVTNFTTIEALFVALHANWTARPMCAACGQPAVLTCKACSPAAYCSKACERALVAHPTWSVAVAGHYRTSSTHCH